MGSGSTNLFKAILKGAEMCEASLPPLPEVLVPATPLPPILNVQMDNATGDKKTDMCLGFGLYWLQRRFFVKYM